MKVIGEHDPVRVAAEPPEREATAPQAEPVAFRPGAQEQVEEPLGHAVEVSRRGHLRMLRSTEV